MLEETKEILPAPIVRDLQTVEEYLKEYKKFEYSLIIYNSEKKEIVDIVDYDVYKAKKDNN